MKQYLVARRYANALSQSIPDNAALEEARTSLNEFAEVLEDSPMLRTTLSNPAILSSDRGKVMESVFEKQHTVDTVHNLVRVLFKRGRIGVIGDVASVFGELVDERLNRVTATVTTASALSDTQAEKVRAGLAAYSGKAVQIETEIDPDIIGGIVVRLGGSVLDGSLRHRLDQLRTSLLKEET